MFGADLQCKEKLAIKIEESLINESEHVCTLTQSQVSAWSGLSLPRSIASDGSLGITEAGLTGEERGRMSRAQKSLDLSRRCEIQFGVVSTASSFSSTFKLIFSKQAIYAVN